MNQAKYPNTATGPAIMQERTRRLLELTYQDWRLHDRKPRRGKSGTKNDSVFVEMQGMQNSVRQGSKHHPKGRRENQADIHPIESEKQLSCIGFGKNQGTHSPRYEHRIKRGVMPLHTVFQP